MAARLRSLFSRFQFQSITAVTATHVLRPTFCERDSTTNQSANLHRNHNGIRHANDQSIFFQNDPQTTNPFVPDHESTNELLLDMDSASTPSQSTHSAQAKSNKKRKGKRKSQYTLDLKLEVYRYHKDRGGSYNDIANCPTFAHLNLSKSTVRDMIKGHSRWLQAKSQCKKKGAGNIKKLNKGKVPKYMEMEKVLFKEYKRNVKVGNDHSRQWCLCRAGEMWCEYQLTGNIRELPFKSQNEWTPHEILQEDITQRTMTKMIDDALQNKKISPFPGQLLIK